MPTLGLSAGEIADVVAFLDWVGHIDTNGWPPRPILVSGVSSPRAPVGGRGLVTVGRAIEPRQGAVQRAEVCDLSLDGVRRGVVGPSLAGSARRRRTDP